MPLIQDLYPSLQGFHADNFSVYGIPIMGKPISEEQTMNYESNVLNPKVSQEKILDPMDQIFGKHCIGNSDDKNVNNEDGKNKTKLKKSISSVILFLNLDYHFKHHTA